MRVTILGSGSSSGTPAIDVGWGACNPADPRNVRTRPSILVEHEGCRLLIDTSPDLRAQLLTAGVSRLDAVLYTHAHADHLHGIDDLRAVNRAIGAALPVYADRQTLDAIHRRFDYVFAPLAAGANSYYKPTLEPREVRRDETVHIGPITVLPFDQNHGFSHTLGYRFGAFAYSTDVVELDEAAFTALAGVQVWVVGTLGDRAHPTHCHVEKALAWIARLRPCRAYLTHLGLDLDHEALARRLPPGVEPACDGLVIDVDAIVAGRPASRGSDATSKDATATRDAAA
jgi:phosphoribosyl 1,2-cyclic phosphate phosphodiesterase